MMLDIEVIRVQFFAEGLGDGPVSAIEICLRFQRGMLAEVTAPSADNVTAGSREVLLTCLIGAPVVEIAMQRECVVTGRIPIGAKSSLSQAPGVARIGAVRKLEIAFGKIG